MSALKIINSWIKNYLSDEEAISLLFLLLLIFAVFFLFGAMLTPVFTSIVLAYLLRGPVIFLTRRGAPEWGSVLLVYVLTLGFFVTFIVVVLPLVWQQLSAFLNAQLPTALKDASLWFETLPGKYPELISADQALQWSTRLSEEIASAAQNILSFSLSKLPNVMALLVYLVLVPVMVFFFLKDSRQIIYWMQSFLPVKRALLKALWLEMDEQISNYIRGKVIEIFIVGLATFICFQIIHVEYAALLGLLVGLSVVVPYVGAVVVTIPVVLVGYFQFGWDAPNSSFLTMMIIYTVIQALDGNVLVPILFSEAVNLHPVAIIVAILIFGGLWGFWGIFFAIPLATLVKAVVSAWPKSFQRDEAMTSPDKVNA